MPKPDSKKLFALTAAALCLPGYSGEARAWADTESEASYRFSFYNEASLPASATNGRDGQRYQVLSNQFHLLRPVGEEFDYSADFAVETMSGASPWYIVPGDTGKPIQIMSGATIEDRRFALDLKGRRYRENEGRESLRLGVSTERDYLSLNGGLESETSFDNKRRTLSLGVGFSHDQLRPTDGASTRFPDRIGSAHKNTVNAFAGLSQLLGPDTVVSGGLSFTYNNGFLSDPYKEAYVAGGIVPDARPSSREQGAVDLRLRQFFPGLNAALHLDYRFFRDSWGVGSDTIELGWYQNLPADWKASANLRWYEQGATDFYRPYYNVARDDGDYSSDYRLSAYGAYSARLGATKEWNGWTFALAGEYYDSSASYTIRRVDSENPGLVDFMVISAAVRYKF